MINGIRKEKKKGSCLQGLHLHPLLARCHFVHISSSPINKTRGKLLSMQILLKSSKCKSIHTFYICLLFNCIEVSKTDDYNQTVATRKSRLIRVYPMLDDQIALDKETQSYREFNLGFPGILKPKSKHTWVILFFHPF